MDRVSPLRSGHGTGEGAWAQDPRKRPALFQPDAARLLAVLDMRGAGVLALAGNSASFARRLPTPGASVVCEMRAADGAERGRPRGMSRLHRPPGLRPGGMPCLWRDVHEAHAAPGDVREAGVPPPAQLPELGRGGQKTQARKMGPADGEHQSKRGAERAPGGKAMIPPTLQGVGATPPRPPETGGGRPPNGTGRTETDIET